MSSFTFYIPKVLPMFNKEFVKNHVGLHLRCEAKVDLVERKNNNDGTGCNMAYVHLTNCNNNHFINDVNNGFAKLYYDHESYWMCLKDTSTRKPLHYKITQLEKEVTRLSNLVDNLIKSSAIGYYTSNEHTPLLSNQMLDQVINISENNFENEIELLSLSDLVAPKNLHEISTMTSPYEDLFTYAIHPSCDDYTILNRDFLEIPVLIRSDNAH